MHALSQQTPSAQWLDAQSMSALHAIPFATPIGAKSTRIVEDMSPENDTACPMSTVGSLPSFQQRSSAAQWNPRGHLAVPASQRRS
jgi:hypothetical protein